MKPLISVVLAGAFLTAAIPAPAQKLSIYGSGGFGLSSAYSKLYNPRTLVTFHGKVSGITVAAPYHGTGNSERVIVRALNGGSMLVELGPQWFVDHQQVKLHLGDKLTVTGSKFVLDGRGSIMARIVVKGRMAMVFRDAAGHPYWAATQPVFANYIGGYPSTTGTAAQEMTSAPATPASTPQTNQNNTPPKAFTSPTALSGAIDHFDFVNGDVVMVMNLGTETQNVYLGPDWYIEHQDVTLNPGDIIVANVLTPIPNPHGVVYAESITSGNSTIYLRNDYGQTVWYPSYPVIYPSGPMPFSP